MKIIGGGGANLMSMIMDGYSEIDYKFQYGLCRRFLGGS